MVGTLREDQHTYLIISCSVLLRMRNIPDKSCRKIKTRILRSLTLFEKCAAYELMWKNVAQPEKTDDNMVHVQFMLGTQRYKHTLLGYVTTLIAFHCNNGCTNAPQHYIKCTLPILFNILGDALL